jgi:hypothetical protein
VIGDSCVDYKRTREHVALALPFRVLELAVGKPLRIGGVARAAGMSGLLIFTLSWQV